MQRNDYQLLIFDWDATLVDSAGDIVACMQEVIAELALPALPDLSIRNIIGLGLSEAIATLYPNADAAQIQRVRACYGHHFRTGRYAQSRFFPGVEDSLQQLRQAGYRLAVATGKSRAGLDRVFTSLNCSAWFENSRCADETRSKPHPQMLLELLRDFDLEPEQAVMIGDTEYDLEMAAKAGMDAIGVSYGAHAVDRLRRHRPLAILDDLRELHAWLGS